MNNASTAAAGPSTGSTRATHGRPARTAKSDTTPKKAAAGGERTPAFPLTAAIVVVADANPKRPGTKAADKWGLYKGCKTVEDVVKAFAKVNLPRRKAMSAIRWDSAHGHIKVG